jgi:hypothetical protein
MEVISQLHASTTFYLKKQTLVPRGGLNAVESARNQTQIIQPVACRCTSLTDCKIHNFKSIPNGNR